MLRGLRVSDVSTLLRLCGNDRKLFLRLGSLLEAHVALTEAALETLTDGTAGRGLLNDRRLGAISPAGFAALAEEIVPDAQVIMIDGDNGAEAGWRVIALADERANPLMDAADAAEAAVTTARDTATDGSPGLAHLVSTLSPALRAPVEGLMQARADDQRAAALEQLRYAMPPLPVVSELMPLILSDAAELVRERAIGLLSGAGAHVAVVDVIRALIRRDDAALGRLAEPVARLGAVQQDLVISAALAGLARGHVTSGMVQLLHRLAGHLSGHRGLERIVTLLLPAKLSLLDLVRSLQHHDRERINHLLALQLGVGSDDQDVQLVVLLAQPGAGPEDLVFRNRLIARGIDLLLSPKDRPAERMALASALRRLDHDGVLATQIAARGMTMAQSYETSVYWLLAELARDHAIPPAVGEDLAVLQRRLLRDAPGPHLVALLEQQLPALVPASERARADLVEPMVEILARFIDERSHDLVSTALTGIGPAAVPPLWILVEEHPHANVRLLASELLPELLRGAEAPPLKAAVKRLLLGLSRSEQARERAALVTAAAILATAPKLSDDPGPAQEVDRAVGALGEWGLDAIGHLAAGPQLSAERRAGLVAGLLDALVADVPNGPAEPVTDPANQEVTWVLDERLGAHTENMPRLLGALYRIGRSQHLDPALQAKIVDRLCRQWRRVAEWKTIWGPANIQDLGRTLGLLAERPDFPGPLRIQVCESLLPNLRQLTIARSLARVFTCAEGPWLSQLAGRAAANLVQLSAEKYYADDEWEELAEVLVDFLAIPHLGPDGAVIRRRLVNVIGAYRAHISSRAKAKLRYLLPELGADLAAKLDWA
jgi:hypothetical protein